MRSILLATAVAILVTPVLAENEIELPTISVLAEQIEDSLTAPSAELAQEKLDAVPGGTTLIRPEQYRDGAVRDIADALRLTPGVFAQSRFGSDEVRLSIRGSGITQTFNSRGVRLLRDGLPLNDADGNVRPQFIDPLVAQYIEVYRGANALEYGAATLGGAINIISPNALALDGYPLRIEAGSNDYRRFQVANGKIIDDDWDIYGSLTGVSQDGFRENARQETIRFYGNLGRQWDSGSETRLHLNIQDNNIELPGSITKEQLETDPSVANAGSLNRNSQRDFDLYRFAVQHSVPLINGGKANFGASFQNAKMFHPLPFALLRADQDDASFSARVQQKFGSSHSLVYGALASWGQSTNPRFRFAGATGANQGTQSRDESNDAAGLELFIQDTIALNDSLDFIAGTQLVYARRENTTTNIDASGIRTALADRSADYTGFSPKLGLVWQAHDNAQLFSNISRSFEAPTTIEFAQTLDDSSNFELGEQTATTFEIGSRGNLGSMNYELALYYADIQDEILFQDDPSTPVGSGITVTSNADKTIHTGVEFGVNGALTPWLDLATAYTYSDFKFDGDVLYGDNEIPGIPNNFANLELSFHNGKGFRVGPTATWADSYFVDFANTLKADSYAIWGLKAAYTPNDSMNFFIEARNLSDKTYASNTGILADAGGNDANVFNPGIDRSFFAGIEVSL